jgi:hypothetical protein
LTKSQNGLLEARFSFASHFSNDGTFTYSSFKRAR